MTPNEFRAWLEGYSASFADGHPNKEQWDAIKAKMDKVIGKPSNGTWQMPYTGGPYKPAGREPEPFRVWF